MVGAVRDAITQARAGSETAMRVSNNRTLEWTGQAGPGTLGAMPTFADGDRYQDAGKAYSENLVHNALLRDAFSLAQPHLKETLGLGAGYRQQYATADRAGLIIPHVETARAENHPHRAQFANAAAAQVARSVTVPTGPMTTTATAYESDF